MELITPSYKLGDGGLGISLLKLSLIKRKKNSAITQLHLT